MRGFLLACFLLLAWAASAHALPRPELPDRIPERPVTEIAFRTRNTLSFAELSSQMPIRIGETLTREKLERSLDALLERDIFAHVDVQLEETESGVKVAFLLVPALILFDMEVSGNSTFEEKQLRRLAGLRFGQRLQMPEVLAAADRIRAGYRREGFHAAQVKVGVVERFVSPQVIVEFDIEEGYHSRFGKVSLSGPLPEDLQKVRERFEAGVEGTLANDDNLKKVRQDLLLAARNEGYLQASAEVLSSELNPLSGDIDLSVRLEPHQPLSLNFKGNKLFSPSELLAPLRLESRSVPFTPSAIHTLCREIRRMYQVEGYFFARCDFRELDSEGTRRNYEVEIAEGRKVRLGDLSFEGNRTFSGAELRRVIETRPVGSFALRPWRTGYLQSEKLSADLAALELFYQEAGFFNTNVNFDLTTSIDQDRLDLVIRIEEGEQTKIEKLNVRWKGALEPDVRGINRLDESGAMLVEVPTTIKEGDAMQAPRLKEEQLRIANEVIIRGYPNAKVELETDEQEKSVTYTIDPGVRVTIAKIWFAGNTTISDRLIRRDLKFRSGALLVANDLRDSEQSLFRSGYFKNVEIRPSDGTLDEASEDLTVRVSERDTGRFELGAAINSQDGFHLFGELGQRNLGGTGRALVMGIDGFFKTGGDRVFDAGNARIVFSEPHLFRTDIEWLNEAFAQYSIDQIDSFSYDRLGGTTSLRYRFTEKLFGTVGMTAFYESLFDVAPDVILGPDDQGDGIFSFLHSQIEFDHRDNAYNPREGFRTVLQARLNSQAFGADADYGALFFQHAIYTPVGKRMVWANNFRTNYLKPFGSTDVIPLGQRVFLGGRNSLRGFSLYSVGPRGEVGNIVGGDASVNFNTELQYDLTDNTVGILFADFGQAFLEEKGEYMGDGLNLGDIRYSPGVGLRYITPIGPISGEVGINPDREEGERWGRIHFSVGGAF